jgi:hypothetical protein
MMGQKSQQSAIVDSRDAIGHNITENLLKRKGGGINGIRLGRLTGSYSQSHMLFLSYKFSHTYYNVQWPGIGSALAMAWYT